MRKTTAPPRMTCASKRAGTPHGGMLGATHRRGLRPLSMGARNPMSNLAESLQRRRDWRGVERVAARLAAAGRRADGGRGLLRRRAGRHGAHGRAVSAVGAVAAQRAAVRRAAAGAAALVVGRSSRRHFPAHLLAELQGNVPVSMVLCWFVSNVTEALIGASFVRWLAGASPGLSSVRTVIVLCGAAALAALLSSFLDAAFVRLVGFGKGDYWSLVQARAPANMLATLIFVPVAMTWSTRAPLLLPVVSRARWWSAAALFGGLLAVSIVAFDTGITYAGSPGLLYLPMPFLIWAALRFGPRLTSASFTVVAFLVIWGAGHGRGPFMHAITAARRAADPAVPDHHRGAAAAAGRGDRGAAASPKRKLRASQELFSTAFKASPDAIAISRRSDGRIIEANDHWLELMGYRRDELARGGVGAARGPPGRRRSRQRRRRWRARPPVRATSRWRCATAAAPRRPALVRIKAVELQGEPMRHQHHARHLRAAAGRDAGARAAHAAHPSDARGLAHRVFERARPRAEPAADGHLEQCPGGAAVSGARPAQRDARSTPSCPRSSRPTNAPAS